MSTREAAAAITAERELLQRAWQWMADNETTIFAASGPAWCQMTLIAADLRAALSAPVAAQPAASGVDAKWVNKAMELATDFGVESLRVGSHERKDNILNNGRASWETVNLREKRKAAREKLRAHLSTAAKEVSDEVMLNGLTRAETDATASVQGLWPGEAVRRPGLVCGRCGCADLLVEDAAPAAQPADSARLAALEAAVQQLCREFGAPQTARVQAAMDRALTAASKERSKSHE